VDICHQTAPNWLGRAKDRRVLLKVLIATVMVAGVTAVALETTSHNRPVLQAGTFEPVTVRHAPARAARTRDGRQTARAKVKSLGTDPRAEAGTFQAGYLSAISGSATGATTGGRSPFVYFFLGDRYLGTDTTKGSVEADPVASDGTTVTVQYPLYRATDALCCATGGNALVRFRLKDSKLIPLDPIPTYPADNTAPAH
jgi:hypothetical protein